MINGIKQFKEKLYFLITEKDKTDIKNVLLLGFIVGLFELLGLALIVLMIQVFTNTRIIDSNKYFQYIYQNTAQNSLTNFVIILSIFILLFYLLKFFLSLINAKKMAIINGNIYLGISKKLFKNYLNYYYADIGLKNTAEINQSLVIETDNLSIFVINAIHIIINSIIILLLYSYMLFIDFQLTMYLSLIMLTLAYVYKIILVEKYTIMGIERLDAVESYMRLIKSTFSNYKFIKSISNSYIADSLTTKVDNYKRTRIEMLYWSEIPRLLLEFIIIALMILVLLFIKLKYEDADNLLLVVSTYALILFRMLPSISRVINGINIINMYKSSLNIIHLDFTRNKETSTTNCILKMNKTIKMTNIIYTYGEINILNNISIEIKKSDKVAIIGESGSGKSTLMDILIGLHLPTGGEFIIDDAKIDKDTIVAWRSNTSFVPQKVMLFESTVKENIIFGKKYDEILMKRVLEDVYMYDTVMNKGGIEAKIGDEVSGFSGGQVQRLALARALYQERDILFLDEATSSLDEEIELKIIDNLLSKYKNKTIIAIVHKESIANKFERILKVENGKIFE